MIKLHKYEVKRAEETLFGVTPTISCTPVFENIYTAKKGTNFDADSYTYLKHK